MKKIFLMLAVAVAALQMTAANVDLVTAQAKAAEFLRSQASGGKLTASQVQFVSQRTITNSSNVTMPVYYIFNTRDNFVIVSGEDRAEEILAVGDQPLDFDHIPANMQGWLNLYQKQIEYLQERPGLVVEVQSKIKAPNRIQTVAPLLTATWDQQSPYWNQCVFNGTQCLTGCPATSLAQVFFYWKYPTAPTPSIAGYTSNGYTIPALPSTTFDWANMRASYGWGATAAQKAAVATLMRYIGQAERMEYGPDGSGISSDRTDLISTACKTFGYDNNVRAIKKSSYYGYSYYTDAQWATLMQNELAAGHPIVYCAISDEGEGGGHAFNVDGYTSSSNKYHINWGWSGAGNGDFALNAFTDIDGMTFDIYQQMVIGIQPPGGQVTFPVITVEPDTIHFGTTKTGTPVTRTFHVSGQNLLGDITFNRSGNGSFSVTPTTLTAAEVMAGADITVTYNPTTSGSHKANIEVSGGAAETTIVVCEGTAEAVPLLTANPMELNFNTTVGESVTGTFNLKGYNLTGAVSVKVLSPANGFTVDKTNVTKTAATTGVDITVTYKPTTAGNHTTRVMLRSKDADTIYVALNGTATVTTYAPVMQPANEAYVTETSFRADWTDQTPASAVTSYTLEYATGGNSQTVTGIANKFFTLNNLTAGALYTYKVKALYFDGTESNWSNTQQVTLLQQPTFTPGDVNNDGFINITDVTALIDYLLNPSEDTDTQAADVNGDGTVNITDVTALIDMLLSGN